uniref:Synaptotagmin 1 n=1 Tax=Aceria tosichella TaxID=561515 RepID=A0A6G1SJP6_9ACAR
MSEAVNSSKLKQHLLLPDRHTAHEQDGRHTKLAARRGGDGTVDEDGDLKRRRWHHSHSSNDDNEETGQAKGKEVSREGKINNTNVRDRSLANHAGRSTDSATKPPKNKQSVGHKRQHHHNHHHRRHSSRPHLRHKHNHRHHHKQHHHHHHHHQQQQQHPSRAPHSYQVVTVQRSNLSHLSSKLHPTLLKHMQYKTDPLPVVDDRPQEPHSIKRGLPSVIVGTTSNHLSGSTISSSGGGKLNAAPLTIAPATAAANAGSSRLSTIELVRPARIASYEPHDFLKSFHHIMLIVGLPLCACLMFGLIFLLLLKYSRCLRRAYKAKQKSNSMKKNSNKMKGLITAPIGFISNGKVFGGKSHSPESDSQVIRIMQGARGAAGSQANKEGGGGHGKALDCRQLTINMDGTDLSTEDSDEQQQQQKQQQTTTATTSSKSKGAPKKLGLLKYCLEYDFNQSVLSVTILEARNLPAMDLNGLSDPYVCVFMANNKNYGMFKTKIHKHTLNPVFNETFKYQISYAELTKQTLILSVYDYDRLSKHDEIGQLTLPMSSIDLARRQLNWSELRKMNDGDAAASLDGRLGDICLSLRYVPTAGRLNVVILEARQLKKMDLAGLSDPYIKLALMSKGKRLKKKKTSIKKCTLNPHYNESFSFEVPFEQAQEVQLVITVVDYDRIGTSEPIGMITLGCEQSSGETEVRHWMDMLASPRRPIAQWHSLKSVDFEPKLPVKVRRFSQFIANK